MFIYTIGTGNATLDALAADSDASNFQEFFPFLPLRLNNVAVDEGVYATNGLFEETRKAYRKANHFKNIEPGDIDFAYIMYGVSSNVQENACRKYIFSISLDPRSDKHSSSDWFTSYAFIRHPDAVVSY